MEDRKYRYMAEYENGSAVRKLQPEWESQEVLQPHIVEQPVVEVRPKTGVGSDIFSILMLVSAILATIYICISYLQVQSDIVQLEKSISILESNIASVSKENDAVQAELDNEITDLDYIYQMAVGVLGMVYPNNNEVIYYDYEDNGYFRQYQDIPE